MPAGGTDAHGSNRTLDVADGPVPSQVKSEAKGKSRARPKGEEDIPDEPRIDPRTIVLEMDLIDKSKLHEEEDEKANATSLANLKSRDPNARDLADQLELVRRQLVLSGMGLEIPTLAGTDDVDQ